MNKPLTVRFIPRYESQHLYNRMLLKQIQRMRAECRMLRCGVELSTDAEIKELETVGDCRKLLRNLKVERWSLLSKLFLKIFFKIDLLKNSHDKCGSRRGYRGVRTPMENPK